MSEAARSHDPFAPAGDAPPAARLTEAELAPPELVEEQEAAFQRDVARLRERAGEFSLAPCPACGAPDGPVAIGKWGFTWRRCVECRTLWLSPRPPAHVLADYYAASESYAVWASSIFPASEASRRDKIARPRLERIVAICERHGVGRDLLVEVGPGFGTFAAIAREAFGRVVAVEPTPGLAAACRAQGVEVVERRIEDVVDETRDADVVCAFEVIEHLLDPGAFLGAIASRVAPGALLVLTCPNGEGFEVGMLGAASLTVDPEHVTLFSPDALAGLVARSGFEVLEVATPGRLDVDFVRMAVEEGRLALADAPWLAPLLADEERAWGFQQALADLGLSSHLWLVARRSA